MLPYQVNLKPSEPAQQEGTPGTSNAIHPIVSAETNTYYCTRAGQARHLVRTSQCSVYPLECFDYVRQAMSIIKHACLNMQPVSMHKHLRRINARAAPQDASLGISGSALYHTRPDRYVLETNIRTVQQNIYRYCGALCLTLFLLVCGSQT